MSDRTVLVLTGEDDPTADAVIEELTRRGTRVARMDVGDFPTRLRLAGRFEGGWRGRLWTDSTAVELADIGSIYYRRPTRFRMPEGLSDGDSVFAAVEARLGFGGVLEALDVLWVNNPARVAVAEYKPLQLKVADDCGLAVPRTLVTNDHESVVAFAAELAGPVICKTLSSLVLSEAGQAQAIYTTPVDPGAIDPARLAVTAHLIQEQIDKAYDVRVTMVGPVCLAVAITSDSPAARIDWRADYHSLTYALVEPPGHVVAAMGRYLAAMGLSYGAFDFAVSRSGEWIMLECNPAGQWLWLERAVGIPVAASLADLLARP
jgi:ATP-grasp ribosomal peptide maturase